MHTSSASIRQIMRATSTSLLTERLPLELLERVLAHMSVQDILRMKQVRRISNCAQKFQLNLPDVVVFARSLVVSTTLSRIRLTLGTESISSPQGWRITLPQTLLLSTNGKPSTTIARNGIPSVPSKSGSENSATCILANKSADPAFAVSLRALQNSSSLLPWSRFHEGYHGKSGSSHSPSLSPHISRLTLTQTC